LNVDPELVAFGAEVAARLSTLAGIGATGSQRTLEGTAAVETDQGDYYDEYGNYRYDDTPDRERRQAVAREKAAAAESAAQVLQGLSTQRAEVRARMTAKYQVEF
jgi:hypothetical protein